MVFVIKKYMGNVGFGNGTLNYYQFIIKKVCVGLGLSSVILISCAKKGEIFCHFKGNNGWIFD